MKHSIKYITEILKKARIEKGLSQRDLSVIIGLPQGHLSKIENGQVDLRVSNLIELARSLELECILVPRNLVKTVEALIEGTDKKDFYGKPMYSLDDDIDEE